MDKKKIEKVNAPLPYPIYPVAYEGSLTQSEAMGQFQYKLNELIDSYNSLIGTFPDVVQTTGTSTTDVMSQNAVSSYLSLKLNYSDVQNTTGDSPYKPISQLAATKGLDSKVSLTDVQNELGPSSSYPIAQQIVTNELSKTNGMLYEKVAKTDILQTTGSNTDKVMSQNAISNAITNAVSRVNTYETVNFYKTSDSDEYKCSHSFASVKGGINDNRRRYYFYRYGVDRDIRCEVFPSSHSESADTLSFEGVFDSSSGGSSILPANEATFVSITMTETLITCLTPRIGVANTEINDVNLAPSMNYANGRYAKYSDIVSSGETPETNKAYSTFYTLQNYNRGYRTGFFSPTYDAATQQIPLTGGITSTNSCYTVEITLNCTFPESAVSNPYIKFTVGAIIPISTTVHLKKGINNIKIQRCTTSANVWTISNITSEGIEACTFTNTQIPTSTTYSAWVMGWSLSMPSGFDVAVTGAYSY